MRCCVWQRVVCLHARNMATCDPQELISASSCWDAYSPQLQLIQTQLLCLILRASNPMATCDPQTLLTESSCWSCLLPAQLQWIQVQLLCEILNGGGTGTTCITCGAADTPPVAPGTCECSIYYTNQANPGLWLWNAGGAVWENVLAPGP